MIKFRLLRWLESCCTAVLGDERSGVVEVTGLEDLGFFWEKVLKSLEWFGLECFEGSN